MEAIEREVTVPAPMDDVWRAVSRADELSRWFGADVELDPRPGGRGVFRWADGTERATVVEDVEPGRRLTFRWLPFQRIASGDVVTIPSSRVEITLHEVPGGTRIRVTERPAFAGAGKAQGRSANRELAALRS